MLNFECCMLYYVECCMLYVEWSSNRRDITNLDERPTYNIQHSTFKISHTTFNIQNKKLKLRL